MIKGALSRLGFQAVVVPEITTLPQCSRCSSCASRRELIFLDRYISSQTSQRRIAQTVSCIQSPLFRRLPLHIQWLQLRKIPEMIQQGASPTVTYRDILAASGEVNARHMSKRRAGCWPVGVRGEGRQMDLCRNIVNHVMIVRRQSDRDLPYAFDPFWCCWLWRATVSHD